MAKDPTTTGNGTNGDPTRTEMSHAERGVISAEPKAAPQVGGKGKPGRASKRNKKRKSEHGNERKSRTMRPFPAASFEDSLTIAEVIQKIGSGQKVRRLTLFEHLQKSPDSGPSRQMVINSGAYGLTTGGYQGEFLELTPEGKVATDPESPLAEKLKARFQLAIHGISWFKLLYDKYVGLKLPSSSVLRDVLRDAEMPAEWLDECVSTFIVNCKFLGLLREIAGAERIISLEHALEGLSSSNPGDASQVAASAVIAVAGTDGWEKKCFYITPIGEEGSEERRHADLFMSALIEPAIQPLGLTVVRADQIGDAGMISSQVLEHLKRCRLAIADMSHRNPNVFYEMALRHAAKLPVVQIIRRADRLPFDLNQVRTVVIDTTDIYALVPKLDIYRSEIQTQARSALDDPAGIGNPITVFYPQFFK